MTARQSQPYTLAEKRQEFPRSRALHAVSKARLSGMLVHSILGRSLGRGQAGSAPVIQEHSSPGGKVEHHFRADSSLGARSEGNSSAYDSIIKQASQRYQVPEGLIKAVIQVESNFNPRATSPAGAMGLMQLKPGTARDLGVRCAYNPGDNVDGGTRFLKDLLDHYEGNVPMALAAYTLGPANLEKGRSLPRETRNYLESVGRLYPLRHVSQRLSRKNLPPSPAVNYDNLSDDELLKGFNQTQRSAPQVVIPGDPRRVISVRQNNPGNIKFSSRDPYAVGAGTKDFAIYPTPQAGFAALESLLDRNYKHLTLEQAAYKYAPSYENDTETWIKNVGGKLGIARNTPLSVVPTPALATAIAEQESSARVAGMAKMVPASYRIGGTIAQRKRTTNLYQPYSVKHGG